MPPLNKMAGCRIKLGILLVRFCIQVNARGRKNAFQMVYAGHFPHPEPKVPVHVGMKGFVNRTNRLVQSTSKERGWLPNVVVKEQSVIGQARQQMVPSQWSSRWICIQVVAIDQIDLGAVANTSATA